MLAIVLSSKPIFMRVFSRKNQCHQHVRKCFTNVPTKVRPLTTFPLSYRSIVVVLLVEDFICASPSSKTHPVPNADKNLNFPEPNRFVCAISELGGIVRRGGSNVHAYCIRGVRRRWSGSFSGLTELCFLIDFYSTLTRACYPAMLSKPVEKNMSNWDYRFIFDEKQVTVYVRSSRVHHTTQIDQSWEYKLMVPQGKSLHSRRRDMMISLWHISTWKWTLNGSN